MTQPNFQFKKVMSKGGELNVEVGLDGVKEVSVGPWQVGGLAFIGVTYDVALERPMEAYIVPWQELMMELVETDLRAFDLVVPNMAAAPVDINKLRA